MASRRRFFGLSLASVGAAALTPLPKAVPTEQERMQALVDDVLAHPDKHPEIISRARQISGQTDPLWVTPKQFVDTVLNDENYTQLFYMTDHQDPTFMGYLNGREIRLNAYGDYAKGLQRGMQAKVESYFDVLSLSHTVVAEADGKYMAVRRG